MTKNIDEMMTLAPWYQNITVDGVNGNHDNVSSEEIFQSFRSMLFDRLEESTFLDIGSNCGYYTNRLVVDGASEATGVERNSRCIEQGEFLKRYFFKNKFDRDKVKFVNSSIKDYFKKIPHTTRWNCIIALSVIYHQKDIYEIAKFCSGMTHMILTRFRRKDRGENEDRTGETFSKYLSEFNFIETDRKEFDGRDFIRYDRMGKLRLLRNHNLIFTDEIYTRGYDEIISKVVGCRHPVVWSRLPDIKGKERKKIDDFVIWVKPEELLHRHMGPNYEVLIRNKKNLIESVKKYGLLNPLVAVKKANGYIVEDGNHRAAISNMLNFDKVMIIPLVEFDKFKNIIN